MLLPQHRRRRRRYEKETKLRELMKMMGMQMKMYWALNFVYDFVMYLVVILLFTLARHTAATSTTVLGRLQAPPPNSNDTFCRLNRQRELTPRRLTAAPTATSSAHVLDTAVSRGHRPATWSSCGSSRRPGS